MEWLIDYVSLINSIQNLHYPSLWRILLLSFIRFAPIVAIAPFLGAKIIPGSARVATALVLSLVFLPNTLFHSTAGIITNSQFVGFAIKEIIIGFFLGFFASTPFFIAQSAGILIDYMRGSSMMMAQDPTLQNQASPIGLLLNFYLIVLFYAIDGPLLFFDAVATSFEVFPIDSYINPLLFNLKNPLWVLTMDILNRVFTLSIQLAAPALLAILMAESFLGIANRLAPQVQIAFLGMSLKSLLGLILLWTAWFIILRQMSQNSTDWLTTIQNLLLKLPFILRST